MREERAEKIIEYVSSMVELYDVNPQRILSELRERDSEVDEALKKVYSSVEGQAFCSECNNMKLRDERQEEFYCPRCS
jgi:Zn finger protein HypA/HybF involved in hydrogenase expression